MNLSALVLLVGLIFGQVWRVPWVVGTITVLDACVFLLLLPKIFKLKFKKPGGLFLSAFLFIFIAMLALILSPLKLNSVELFTSFSYTIRFTSYILLGLVLFSNTFILMLSGIILAILGLLQLIFIPNLSFLESFGFDGHFFRTVSTFLDPNFVGAYFVLTLLLIITRPNFFSKKTWLAVFILVYLALLTTFSRGSYLMFGVSFTALSLLTRSPKIATATVLLSLGLFLGFQLYQKDVAKPKNIDRVQSARYRIDSWQNGWEIFSRNPILGVGFNAYRYGLRDYDLVPKSYLQSRAATGNDSSLLFVASTTGVIGLSAYLLFLSSLVLTGKKAILSGNLLGHASLAGLLGLIAHSFFANSLFYPPLLLWMILIFSKLKSKEDEQL